MRDGEVDGDPVQPGADRRDIFGVPFEGTLKSFLRQILSRGAVEDDTARMVR